MWWPVCNRLLDSATITVDENDAVHTKDEMLALLALLAPGLTGDLAIDVTHEDNEYEANESA
ncbi:MAG: hypothetical protein ABI446_06640 [Gemmatimonadaceae bacterium]